MDRADSHQMLMDMGFICNSPLTEERVLLESYAREAAIPNAVLRGQEEMVPSRRCGERPLCQPQRASLVLSIQRCKGALAKHFAIHGGVLKLWEWKHLKFHLKDYL